MKTLNEVKKELYKQNPVAQFKYVYKSHAYYVVEVSERQIEFEIPCSDMGESKFMNEMEAKLLIRWIYWEEQE